MAFFYPILLIGCRMKMLHSLWCGPLVQHKLYFIWAYQCRRPFCNGYELICFFSLVEHMYSTLKHIAVPFLCAGTSLWQDPPAILFDAVYAITLHNFGTVSLKDPVITTVTTVWPGDYKECLQVQCRDERLLWCHESKQKHDRERDRHQPDGFNMLIIFAIILHDTAKRGAGNIEWSERGLHTSPLLLPRSQQGRDSEAAEQRPVQEKVDTWSM